MRLAMICSTFFMPGLTFTSTSAAIACPIPSDPYSVILSEAKIYAAAYPRRGRPPHHPWHTAQRPREVAAWNF